MNRGEVYDAQLSPTLGSEQAGTRPVVVVSRDAINQASPVVLIVPCTSFRGQRIYPSQVLLQAPVGGLDQDSVAMAEQVRAIDKQRLGRLRGGLTRAAMRQMDRALLIALDLPGGTKRRPSRAHLVPKTAATASLRSVRSRKHPRQASGRSGPALAPRKATARPYRKWWLPSG